MPEGYCAGLEGVLQNKVSWPTWSGLGSGGETQAAETIGSEFSPDHLLSFIPCLGPVLLYHLQPAQPSPALCYAALILSRPPYRLSCDSAREKSMEEACSSPDSPTTHCSKGLWT